MRSLALPLLLAALLLAGSAPAQQVGETLDSELKRARADQATAEAEAAKLEAAASHAQGEAERLYAQQQAAAQAIDAAEARITTADAKVRLASAYVAAHQRQLAEEQQPVSSLLAGLALMARRPPLLALADQGGTDELVKVRILLDSTLPVIRARTGQLSAQLAQDQRLRQSALDARAELVRNQHDLASKRQQFAMLERQAMERAIATGGQALGASDVAMAAGETAEQLTAGQSGRRAAAALAAQLAADGPAPPRPSPPEEAPARSPFVYQLPAAAPVTDGLGSVDANGVRSRGLTLATARGAPVSAPADGTVRFSGPFRDYDGIVIIDHGGGWMSVIVNVASTLQPGAKVGLGEPLGRALGPIEVELSRNGQRISPALIAGSSQTLSKGTKAG